MGLIQRWYTATQTTILMFYQTLFWLINDGLQGPRSSDIAGIDEGFRHMSAYFGIFKSCQQMKPYVVGMIQEYLPLTKCNGMQMMDG